MKQTLLLISGLVCSSMFAQTFTDNFDSYNAGQALCPQSMGAWTTWSNAPGGPEDVLVSNANSVSGNNSLYFSSSASGGGPTDLVRNFGVLNTGQFHMEMNILVETGKSAYFNLQRNATIGQVWAFDMTFNDNGTMSVTNTAGLNQTGMYTQGQWFLFELDVNFNSNQWVVSINGNQIWSFANPTNQIASIDIFPVDQNTPFSSGFYVDDFSTTITPYNLPALNLAANNVRFTEGTLAGTQGNPIVKIRNLGTTTITSADIEVNYNGNTINQTASGLNLASLAETEVTFTNTVTFVSGNLPISATVSNPNNGTDLDPTDNVYDGSLNVITPAAGKMVVGEEGTGTWCQWCPRGAVYMDLMQDKYPDHWAGIAVHNGDPMTDSPYDAAMAALISGYPSAVVDRGESIDPSEMEPDFITRVQIAPKAVITNGATFNTSTRELKVSVSANFQSAATNAYKLAVVLTEDGVTGTGSGWAQSNAYAGGNAGVMGGYESLPNPVPASQMVYDHVARSIAPSFGGSNAMFPASIASGATHTLNFTFILPATWDENEIEIIGLLIDGTGKIDNAGKATIAEAVANGFVSGTEVASVEELSQPDNLVSVYPNPSSTSSNILLNLKEANEVSVKIFDVDGKEMAAKNYGILEGAQNLPLNMLNLANGMYVIHISIGQNLIQKQLIKG